MGTQPNLYPLQQSFARDDLEQDMKDLFIELYEGYLRAQERRINFYGMPHRGDIVTVERHVKQEGLTLFRRDTTTEPFMREILRAWRAQHSRRGLGFLRFYLQMLWPNAFEIKDLWQIKAQPYPYGLSTVPGTNKFLTSRRAIWLNIDDVPDPLELVNITPSLRRVVPARIVLDVALILGAEFYDTEAAGAFLGVGCMTFEDGSLGDDNPTL